MRELTYLCLEDRERIAPSRGIVLTQNAKGEPFDLIDCQRWVRTSCEIFKLLKIDICCGNFRVFPQLARDAADLGMRVSLRTDCGSMPDAAFEEMLIRDERLRAALLDVFLTPRSVDTREFQAWMALCGRLELPVRLQVQPPFSGEPEAYAARIARPGVAVINVALHDPFVPSHPCRDGADSEETVAYMNRLAAALRSRNIEANLISLPFCLVHADNLGIAANRRQFVRDHQQYSDQAYSFAEKLFLRRPSAAARALVIPLGRNRGQMWFLDHRMLPWIVESPWLHARLLMWRKLTRTMRRFGIKRRPIDESEPACKRELARISAKAARRLGPRCSQCRLRLICDTENSTWRRILPGLNVTPQPGRVEMAPLHLASGQRKWYDAVDVERLNASAIETELAETARQIVANVPPTREVASDAYEIDGQWTHHMPGGNRWYAFTDGEKLSSPLARTEPPLTISVTFGGGIAELAGFSFGRHSKLLCPMVTYSHQLIAHVDERGRFVLLRDGQPVRPVEFEGNLFVPARLAGVVEPRISLWNINGSIVTQTVLVWEGNASAAEQMSRVKYSVFIVTTRYARRLQAVLLSLVHQRGFDLGKLEVIIGYVPGMDATEDVIDSMQMAHPELRIVRAPFQEGYAKSKGFLINESARLASGEWLVLLDSDTLVAPEMFAHMETVPDSCMFVAPDGRKMLTPQTTAQVLLGHIRPWEQWEELLQGPGEFRLREADGVPIGFFQAVKKACLDKVRYVEMDHFEGADWFFGHTIREEFGEELRLKDMPVLHLDHGGSQWYGTSKHR